MNNKDKNNVNSENKMVRISSTDDINSSNYVIDDSKNKANQIWEQLSISDNFIFLKMMQNQELCKKILSEIIDKQIMKIEYPEYEKTIDIRREAKSIRLDVYVKDEVGTVYNVEMQNVKVDNIPKRGRYYQDLIDLDLLEKGCRYRELNKSIIIFICTFDLYGQGMYKYTFTNLCHENHNIEYGDDTTKIVINTLGTKGNVSKDLIDFLKSVNGEFTSSEFSDRIKRELESVKRSENNRREFMTLYLHEEEIKRESYERGVEAGRIEGMEEGREEGREEGLSLGKSQGKIEQTIKFLLKDKITIDEAMEELNIKREELDNLVEEYKKNS